MNKLDELLDEMFPQTGEEIRAVLAQIDRQPCELPERLRNADVVFDRMIESLADKWWRSLSPESQVKALSDQGTGGTVMDAYRDWIAEHEACVICGTVMHFEAMLKVVDNGLVCGEACKAAAIARAREDGE